MKAFWVVVLLTAFAARGDETNEVARRLQAVEEGLSHLETRLSRQMNELLWMQRLGEVAVIDKVRFTGPPPRTADNPTPPAGSNEVVVSALAFMPRHPHHGRKVPLIVFAHSEIHGNLVNDEDAHVVLELVQ